ncbi:hypothetical protein EV137_7295 [Kribbella pratensis]|jgi:hypothetical protein|uniref:Uncharacterized protein n=1 Tax=Kribbella pratensis TaxID=2512112 RepID=A0ABY2F7X7_9ACTN|nr:hypothetical protein [Kribbella pratensis]TDW84481.1 hypothetical protein EV137_7295 [Kribbella pratensis]
MSVVDSVFLAVSGGQQEVVDWLVEGVGAEVLVTETSAVRLRMRGESAADWLGVVVQPNGYVVPDPEPDEVQAMDGYAIEVQVRGGGSDDILHREAGRLFETLITTRPEVPALLVHNLDTLVSAHLPGAGTHTFDPLITPDVEDIDTWRAWVRG